MTKYALILLCVFSWGYSFGQTCCTGGTPLLGSYVFSALKSGDMALHSTLNHNSNKDLISGKDELDESFIRRDVSAIILQADYAISDFFLISVVFPYLIQKETITTQSGKNKFKNNGLSDASIWGHYHVEKPFYEIGVAVGVKFPSGSTNSESNNGILLPFSMQLGSGSFDFGSNMQAVFFPSENRKLSLISQYALKINTTGNRFDAHHNYKFGNQYQALQSISYQYIVGTFVSYPYVGFVYQYREMDQFDGGFSNENTGGHWVNLVAGQSTSVTPNIKVGVNFLLPIYRNLNGLQLSTTWQGSISIGYIIQRRDEIFDTNF